MADRIPLMAGNWKMNLNHFEANALIQKLAGWFTDKDFDAVDVAVLPPFTDLRTVQTCVDGDHLRIAYGAQDLSPHDSGAYTGDIGGPMLAKLGCSFVTIGHSERREHHHETDEVVNAKVLAAYKHGITPILCVGEPLEVRQAGEHVTHCMTQLRADVAGLNATQAKSLVVAYEPIWAIGTGEVATPDDAQEVCAAIRATLAEVFTPTAAAGARVLYGGSVKPDNVAAIMEQADVDGALVGGASLVAEDFVRIVRFSEQSAA